MTITAGTYTFGSGGTYATLNTLLNDIDISGLTGNLTADQVGSYTETVVHNSSGPKMPLGGFKLHIKNTASPHLGIFGDGYIASYNTTNSNLVTSGAGDFEIEGLQIKNVYTSNVSNPYIISHVGTANSSYHDILVDCNLKNTNFALNFNGAGAAAFEMYRCVAANTAWTAAGGHQLAGYPANNASSIKIYQNVVHLGPLSANTGMDFALNTFVASTIIANNVVINEGSGACYTYTGFESNLIVSKYMYNNAASDGTLSGSNSPQENIVPATEYESIVFGAADYLVPTSTSVLKEAGTATNNPTTEDIAGTTYGTSPPIGSFVALVAVITKYFRALSDAKWSNDLNWSLSPGGPNDTTKAVAADHAVIEATLHVDTVEACLSFINSGNYSYTFDSTLDVSTDFEINAIGALQGTGTVTIQGDFAFTEKASNSNTISFTLNGTLDQGLDLSGTSQGGSGIILVVNKVSGIVSPIIDMFDPPSGEVSLTLTAGVFDALTFKCYFKDLIVNGGTYNGGSAINSVDQTFEINGGIFNATTDVMSLNGSIANAWLKTGGTFNHMNGQVDFISTSQYQECSNVGVTVFYKLRIAKNVYDFDVLTTKIQVADRLIIDNDVSSKSPEFSGTIEMTGTATMEQNGNLYGGGVIKFIGTNHIWLQNNINANAQVPPITVDCTDLTLTPSVATNNFGIPTLTWISGTITNAELYNFRNNKQFTHMVWDLYTPLTIGAMQWDSGNFDFNIADQNLIIAGDYDVTGISSGSQFTGGTIEVQGNYTQTSSGGASQSNGNLIFNGTGAQSIFVDGGGVGRLLCTSATVNKPSGTLTFLNDIELGWGTSDFTHAAGTLDLNGFDLDAGNDVTICADCADLSGSTFTAGGTFFGKSAILEGLSAWFIVAPSGVSFTACCIKFCDNSANVDAFAQASQDGGGNINITFIGALLFWISAGAGDSDNNALYSLTSGGPNDATAPTFDDAVIFDANGLGDCNWKTVEVVEIRISSAYTGTITQSASLLITDDLKQDNGTWIASGYTLQVDGVRSGVTPAVFIQDSSAGSSLYIGKGLNWPSTQTGNAWDSNDIIYGYGNTGIIFEMRNDDFKSRLNVTMTPGNTYRMIGRCYFDIVKAAGGTYIITDNGSSQLITDCDYDAMDEIDFQPTLINRITLTLDGIQFNGVVDLGGCWIAAGDGFDIPVGAVYTNGGIVEHWTSAGATGTIQGYFACETYRQGSPLATNRGGDMTVTGTLVVNGITTVEEDNTILVNRLDISGATLFKTGSLVVEVAAEFNFDGVTFSTPGDVTFDAGSTISANGGRIKLFGAAAQIVTANGKLTSGGSFDGFSEFKSGGSISYADAWTAVGAYCIRVLGAYTTTFLAAANYAASLIDANVGAAVGESIRVTVQSTATGVTKFNFVVSGAGPVSRNVDVTDWNLTGAIQDAATESTANNGNNTIAGLEGWNFVSSPLPVSNYGSYSRSIGLGLGIGGGTAYPSIN